MPISRPLGPLLAILLFGCGRQAPAPSGPHMPERILEVTGTPIPEDNCANKVAAKTIVLNLRSVIADLARPEQAIDRDIKDGANGVDAPAYDPANWNTNLDMQLKKAWIDGRRVDLKIVLREGVNRKIKFIAPFTPAAQPESTISEKAVRQAGGDNIFCARGPIVLNPVSNPTIRTITIGIEGKPKDTAYLNIGLLVPDSQNRFYLPIILDPKVHNEG